MDKLEQLTGEMLATQAAIRALIALHPDPNTAALAVQREIDKLTAIGLGKPVSDSFLDGIARARQLVLPRFHQ